jgi:hypothetical protein
LYGLSTNEVGSNFTVVPPDHLVSFLDDIVVVGKEQNKFFGNLESHDINPYAFVGNIHEKTLARRSVGAGPYLHDMI